MKLIIEIILIFAVLIGILLLILHVMKLKNSVYFESSHSNEDMLKKAGFKITDIDTITKHNDDEGNS